MIAGLDADQFRALERSIGGPDAFTVRGARPARLAEELGLSEVSDAVAVLSSMEFLYEQLHFGDNLPQSVPAAVEELLKTSGLWAYLGDNAAESLDRLAKLLAKNASLEKQKKTHWLQTGMLDHAFGFASFVDLRPNFTDDRSSIQEYVPAIIFKAEIQKENGTEDCFVFQLTEPGLSEMLKTIQDVQRKLQRLRAEGIIAPASTELPE